MENNDKELILSVRNLKQHFKTGSGKKKLVVKAVDGVSFDIYKGEVFGLVGESGCGKTTTGRSIINIYDPTDGEVYFKGRRTAFGLGDDPTRKKDFKLEKKKVIAENKPKIKELQNQLKIEKNAIKEEKKLIAINNKPKIEELKKKLHHVRDENKLKEKECRIQIKLLEDSLNNEENTTEQSRAIRAEIKIKQRELSNIITSNATFEIEKEIDEIHAESELTNDKIKEIENEIHSLDLKIKDYTKANDIELMKKMQMIFQDPIASLNPRMTVKEIISEGLIVNGERNRRIITEKVNKALETVGLVPEHAGRYPHEFSGGQRQRIGIARALIVAPELIIADEPISALDVSIQAQVINLMNDLKENLGITILFIAHDLSVVKYFSDRIGVMYFGNMVELATAEELFKNPLHPYTKSLLSAVPLPDPLYEKKRKRITYSPSIHNYDKSPAKMHEIKEGHFVYANEEELEKYKAELKE